MDQWHLHPTLHGDLNTGGPGPFAKVHNFQPATGAPIMTQERVKEAHLLALLIKTVIKFEHSRLWSFEIPAEATHTNILRAVGHINSLQKTGESNVKQNADFTSRESTAFHVPRIQRYTTQQVRINVSLQLFYRRCD